MLVQKGFEICFEIYLACIRHKLVGNPEVDDLIPATGAIRLTAMAGSRIQGGADKASAAIMAVDGDPACGECQQYCHNDICGLFKHFLKYLLLIQCDKVTTIRYNTEFIFSDSSKPDP